MDRRTLLKLAVNTGGALVAGIVGIPAMIAGFSPAWRGRRGPMWSRVGPLEDFPLDQVELATVEVRRADWGESLREKAVYVWRRDDQEPVVFSRDCTDLGCPVNYDPGSQCFFCPCHGGIFAKNGDRMAGPPKIPLYRYATRVTDGTLEIDLHSVPLMT